MLKSLDRISCLDVPQGWLNLLKSGYSMIFCAMLFISSCVFSPAMIVEVSGYGDVDLDCLAVWEPPFLCSLFMVYGFYLAYTGRAPVISNKARDRVAEKYTDL